MSNILGNLLTGNQGQVDKGFNQMGIPVAANQGGFSGQPVPPITTGAGLPGATGITGHNPLEPGGTIKPTMPPLPTGAIPYQQAYNSNNGVGQLLQSNPTAPVAVPGAPGTTPTGAPTQASPYSNMTPQQQQQLQKQLIDTFGKGEGNLLYSLISSIGGSDDAYMQAYQQAMAGPNAEGLAALNTTFGNSGISANSSAFAIGNADFQSNIVSQEGFQEQQLKMNDLQQLIGLTQGLQSGSAAEVSSGGFLNDLASITSSIGNLIPFGSGGNKGNAGNVGVTGSQGAPNISASTEAQPLGEGAIPLTPTDTTTLPGIDDTSDINNFIGPQVFV